jgi:hypothetical protein
MARGKLSGALLAQKGAAAPATHSDGARQSASPRALLEGEGSKPIALTLKVDQARYEALKVLGARTRRSNQEILLAAFDAYLHAGEG